METSEVVTIFAVVATNLLTVITLYCQSDRKIEAILQEMKDFHGRLERQDAEFKGRLALQDAEFKNHMIQHHGENKDRK